MVFLSKEIETKDKYVKPEAEFYYASDLLQDEVLYIVSFGGVGDNSEDDPFND